ncbi:basic proline-rich protein-like [Panthera tigris]|uniref:basic proline-rich protein-like n=1 Tax=Panthera tigris TaxID=9694 RepID=UPI001C6FB5F8|nr:basic proline-rich protein-like [Panthera tigris]
MSLQLTDGSGRGTGVPLALNKEKCRKQELRASGQGHGSWTTHDILQGHTRCGGARRRGACPTWAHRGRLGAQESRVWSGVWRQCGSPWGQGGGGQGPSARAPADGDAGPEASGADHVGRRGSWEQRRAGRKPGAARPVPRGLLALAHGVLLVPKAWCPPQAPAGPGKVRGRRPRAELRGPGQRWAVPRPPPPLPVAGAPPGPLPCKAAPSECAVVPSPLGPGVPPCGCVVSGARPHDHGCLFVPPASKDKLKALPSALRMRWLPELSAPASGNPLRGQPPAWFSSWWASARTGLHSWMTRTLGRCSARFTATGSPELSSVPSQSTPGSRFASWAPVATAGPRGPAPPPPPWLLSGHPCRRPSLL